MSVSRECGADRGNVGECVHFDLRDCQSIVIAKHRDRMTSRERL